tara:strand:- start:136 stop:933 length:798 start_codon:yes stop_codon:yes gene_type:complete
MPEGPEVKIASKYFNLFFNDSKKIKFEIITDYYYEKYNAVFKSINKNLRAFKPSYTIGKNIFIDLNNDSIFNFHLGMTGGWSSEKVKHCHFRVFNESQELFFRDIRKFGKMRIISKSQLLKKHNPNFDLLHQEYNLTKHINFLSDKIRPNKTICSILMNQQYFPGVGNYIKSEALFAAKLHPEEKWINITKKKKLDLIKKTKEIMLQSYKSGGAELRDFKNPFNKSKFKLHIYGREYIEDGLLVTSKLTSDNRKTWYSQEKQRLM